MTPYANFDLSVIESCSEIPACRGPEVLAILVEIDPISGKESEKYPHFYPKDYHSSLPHSSSALQISRFAAQGFIIFQLQLDHRYKCPPIDFCDPVALLGILRNSPNASNRASGQRNYQTNILCGPAGPQVERYHEVVQVLASIRRARLLRNGKRKTVLAKPLSTNQSLVSQALASRHAWQNG